MTDLLNQSRDGVRATPRREEGVRVLRVTLSQAILVISGPSRMMYQCFGLKPEGAIFSKRSKPQGTYSSPHDTATSMAEQLEMNIQGEVNGGRESLFG